MVRPREEILLDLMETARVLDDVQLERAVAVLGEIASPEQVERAPPVLRLKERVSHSDFLAKLSDRIRSASD